MPNAIVPTNHFAITGSVKSGFNSLLFSSFSFSVNVAIFIVSNGI